MTEEADLVSLSNESGHLPGTSHLSAGALIRWI